MKTVFVIDGAAGTGKSDLVRYLSTRRRTVSQMIQKFTTRHERPEEKGLKLDLLFPADSHEQFAKRTEDPDFYWYTYGSKKHGEEKYGFYKQNIIDALREFDFVFVIVRDREVAETLKRELPNVRVISVFVYADRDLIRDRLLADGYSDEDIERRLNRQPLAWGDYLKHSSNFDEVIVNSSTHSDYEIVLENLFEKYTRDDPKLLQITPDHTYPLPAPLIGFREQIVRKMDTHPFDKNVFLMMKFRGEKNYRVYQYIKKALQSHGLNCVRADEPYWDITRNTYNPIAVLYCCKFGIALFDEPEPGNDYSPNVAYELGMMHSQNKECLVLRNASIASVPFDLAKELYVDYRDNLELEEILEQWAGKIL